LQCSKKTKKGFPCPINADRFFEGRPVCHVHDPNGIAAMNQKADTFIKNAEATHRRPESPQSYAEAMKAVRELSERVDNLEATIENLRNLL